MANEMGYGAGAAAGLEDVLTRLRLKQLDNERRHNADADRLFREGQSAEQIRQFNATQDRLVAGDKADAEERARVAARQREADERAAAERAELSKLLSDPSSLNTAPAWARLVNLNRLGAGNNLNIHAVESPTEHAAHEKVERDAEFSDWQRRANHQNDLISGRLQMRGTTRRAPGADDPELPRGVQSHLVAIRGRNPNFESALREFGNSLEAHRSAHPKLSDVKAVNALRQLYTGAASGGDDLLDAFLNDDDGQSSGGNGTGPTANVYGGPDVNAGPRKTQQQAPSHPALSNPGTRQQLEVGAASTLRRNGFAPTPENIQRFLGDPNNVQLLITGGQ